MPVVFMHVYQMVRRWAEQHSIRVCEELLPPGTAGSFDGQSVTMNSGYDWEERAYYLIHALGSIVLWSQDRKGVQRLFDDLQAAKAVRETDQGRLEHSIDLYRDFETDSSSLAVWLLADLNLPEAIVPYTNFMRADLEALTRFHRHGHALVWRTFFRQWNEEVSEGRRIVAPFSPKPIPAFQPVRIERQKILQEQDAVSERLHSTPWETAMDSINKNQPEDNRSDLRGKEAVAKIQAIVADAKSCFFCTVDPGGEIAARPMNVRNVDDEGNLWFLSAADSHKNQELTAESTVALYFQGSPHSDFLHLKGRATVSKDRQKIEELWEPHIKTWFTEGVDDPRITVIKVVPSEGYYWDTKHGYAVAGVKMLIGAMFGTTMDDSIEGTVKP